MALVYCQGDSPLADGLAKEAAEYLVSSYPNHSWWVEARQGILVIKHFEASGLYGVVGMVRHLASLGHDARVRKHEIVVAAGELLERAGLARGPRGEDPVRSIELEEGMDKHWFKPVHMKVIH